MYEQLNQLREALEQSNTALLALLSLLIEKEIITEEEFVKAKLFAQHIEDQESASRKEEYYKKLKQNHPGLYNLFKKIDDEELE